MRPSAAVAIVGAIPGALGAAPLLAQSQQMAPTVSPPATAPVAPPDVKMVAANTKGRRWLKADARVCLEFPNDKQIVKCSENYR